MAATVTLSTTTLSVDVGGGADTVIRVASTTGFTPGIRLYVDRELLTVVGLLVGTQVQVERGVDGTAATAHGANATIYIGQASHFFQQDPQGLAPGAAPVNPWINTATGAIWVISGSGSSAVWVQTQTLTSPTITSPTITAPVITQPVATYTADGAVTISPGVVLLAKTSAAAMTVAAPGAAGVGQILHFTTTTDFAHVVTFTGGTLWDGTAGANSTWTTAAVQGSSLTIVGVSATKWNVLNFNLGTIAP